MAGRSVICGLKLTHDGAVAVIEDGRLLFSTETEKVANRPRHSDLHLISDILGELGAHGIDPASISSVAVDGWSPQYDGSSYVHLIDAAGTPVPLSVAGYHDDPTETPVPLRAVSGPLPAFGVPETFASYTHSAGHLCAGYATSPYATTGRPALVLVWDGGMPPFLYVFDPAGRAGACVRVIGRVTGFAGGLYPIFASHFGPFRVDRRSAAKTGQFGMAALFPVSGKAMAYAGLGKPVEAAIEQMVLATTELAPVDTAMRSFQWSARVLDLVAPAGLSDAEVLASFQEYLFRELRAGLVAMVDRYPELRGLPICLSGGCALNIKWNSGLRASGLFDDVWVPPFPNDAGSAIGTACAEMIRTTGVSALSWSEFAGPEIRWSGEIPDDWTGRPCTVPELAALLHTEGEPVVFLSGRAELGPRALGHRSIIAPATHESTRARLNEMKGREWYRPVAPICLVEHAAEVFAPGNRDPYMLFDHDVRPGWLERIPAVVHVDGSARLQTVGPDNAEVYELLRAYHALSGIPVLCNTSANLPGRGFFPDPASAMSWEPARYVWHSGTLYHRTAE